MFLFVLYYKRDKYIKTVEVNITNKIDLYHSNNIFLISFIFVKITFYFTAKNSSH